MTTLCRWCAKELNADETIVGFGDGSGREYVHRHCWDEYHNLRRSLDKTVFADVFMKLIQVHQLVIQRLELNEELQRQ